MTRILPSCFSSASLIGYTLSSLDDELSQDSVDFNIESRW